MENSFEIRSSDFQHNMAPWCIEKASGVVRELASIAELVNNQQTISEELRGEMMSSLYPALWDATKMLAFSCGAEWNTSDIETLLKGREAAFEELQVKYGLLRETRAQKEVRDVKEFISSCQELLCGDKSPNRTLMHGLISCTRINDPLVQTLGDRLEQVTMGVVEWPVFVLQAQGILTELERKTNYHSDA